MFMSLVGLAPCLVSMQVLPITAFGRSIVTSSLLTHPLNGLNMFAHLIEGTGMEACMDSTDRLLDVAEFESKTALAVERGKEYGKGCIEEVNFLSDPIGEEYIVEIPDA